MKRILLTIALSTVAITSIRADLIWFEPFNYTSGQHIVTSSTNLWVQNTGLTDDIVNNGRLENASGAPLSRTGDVERRIAATAGSPYTNGQQVTYASYIINCTNFPSSSSFTYHFHFVSLANGFLGKLFTLTTSASLPNTWRIAASGSANTPSANLNIDLATNVNYQIVQAYDPINALTKIWVNPVSSNDVCVTSTDLVSGTPTNGWFQSRQSTDGNFFATIDNLSLATTFDEALTNTLGTNAVSPTVLRSPASRTNFVGDIVSLAALVAGQGQANMTYQWQLEGTNIVNPAGNGNTNVFVINSAVATDSGNYTLIATTPFGLSATSTVCYLWVTNPPIPPTITVQPATNTSVYTHLTATLNVTASGPPPLSYTWSYNGGALGGNVSGDGTPTLTISDVQAANGTAGAYQVVVANTYGSATSTVANVSVLIPPAVSIAYLRTLVDPTTYNATNSSILYEATGTVTTFTNITSGNTSSYYLQDSTAGINIFATFASTFRPMQGDRVTWVGFLSSFSSGLELGADSVNSPASSYTIISNNLPLPAPRVIAFNITNNLDFSEKTLEGSVVMLTNVYFGTNAGNVISAAANSTIVVTNANGETFNVFFSSLDLDTVGRTLPSFARSVVGIFTQNLPNTTTPRNQGYSITVTRFSDIVTDAPPAVTLAVSHSGNKTTLTWPNVSWDNVNYSYGSNYSYTVLAASTVTGPYAPIPTFQARTLGVNEVPANASTATGFGTVALSPDQTTITVNFSFNGLAAAASAAHIHGPAAPGANAGVLFGFSGVPNATSGSIPEQSFAINGTQLGYLTNGLLYMNVHNSVYPGGEMRAQILPYPSAGLTFANSSLTNTAPTTATYTDINAAVPVKFYKVVSP
jgi:hypothetical protein